MDGGGKAVCASDGDKKTVLGPEHPDTLTSMHNLASTYRDQGRWTEAEKLFVQVMETEKTVLGPEHPDTLTSMSQPGIYLPRIRDDGRRRKSWMCK